MGCPIFKSQYSSNMAPTDPLKKKVVVVGLESSGKSTILNYFKFNQFIPEVTPTLGVSIETLLSENLELLIFDISGKVRSLWSHYYENLDALIMVIDITDREKMAEVKDEILKLNEDLIKLKNYKGFVMILFNKTDMLEKNSLETSFSSFVDECGVNEFTEMDVIVLKCSAKSGDGLSEAYRKLLEFLKISDKMNQIGGMGFSSSERSMNVSDISLMNTHK